ncbi:hypothetical protein [Trichormus azollae]|uniref:hypothetical protein n=1 Tax=Trichormus azollae TaxID=1164 RepID=UPI00325F1126
MIVTEDIIFLQLISPLGNGDELTRIEFEHSYHTMPDVKTVDLIERIVYIASPVRYKIMVNLMLILWLD